MYIYYTLLTETAYTLMAEGRGAEDAIIGRDSLVWEIGDSVLEFNSLGNEKLITSAECLIRLYPNRAWNVRATKMDNNTLLSLEVIGMMVDQNSVTNRSTRTFTDLGASDHNFVNRGDFTEYTAFEIPTKGQSADKSGRFKIMVTGTVVKTIESQGKQTTLTFKSVLHAPGMMTNLVSLGKFTEAGFTGVELSSETSLKTCMQVVFASGQPAHSCSRQKMYHQQKRG